MIGSYWLHNYPIVVARGSGKSFIHWLMIRRIVRHLDIDRSMTSDDVTIFTDLLYCKEWRLSHGR